ncbi:uncharacterized protein BP01DRAFT_353672 [Aspergillus saccharolyticus JOP 1030-1]|uniref:NmrA-like domain-containing protein n=1 Tax=Aspergillus saccharolyticus JOP 1030-1 TaxID=1450539 RepID=A0A318ZLM5_9EURO|nr:hypothetical protein BP01DRAFT_353672 [Aspergillus saccharolyticus JOP 1030-1]PYH48511.1 hypothetical protein BP01DRAFT_353672 [Aspergillus saccharolyticus JOP 1030-1]
MPKGSLRASQYLSTAVHDLLSATIGDLVPLLNNVEIFKSGLNGKALAAQRIVQDAAARAGVKRFYPSDYGMHHAYSPPGKEDQMGYLHPTWNLKFTANEQCLHHPAILSGKMTNTLIGCGDFYNQPRETTWWSWANPGPPRQPRHPHRGRCGRQGRFHAHRRSGCVPCSDARASRAIGEPHAEFCERPHLL